MEIERQSRGRIDTLIQRPIESVWRNSVSCCSILFYVVLCWGGSCSITDALFGSFLRGSPSFSTYFSLSLLLSLMLAPTQIYFGICLSFFSFFTALVQIGQAPVECPRVDSATPHYWGGRRYGCLWWRRRTSGPPARIHCSASARRGPGVHLLWIAVQTKGHVSRFTNGLTLPMGWRMTEMKVYLER